MYFMSSYVTSLEQRIDELQEALAVSEAKIVTLQAYVPRWSVPDKIFDVVGPHSWEVKYMINGICLATIMRSISGNGTYHVDMSPPVPGNFVTVADARAHVETIFGPKYAR
jgi:hypothetical protein